VPKEVRALGLEIWEVGRIVAARHSPTIPATIPALGQSHSSPPDCEVMTCSTVEAATRLHLSAREVRFLRERGRLGGHVVGGRLRIPIADVDTLVTERKTRP
jgi:excisionase family DNA binding protein